MLAAAVRRAAERGQVELLEGAVAVRHAHRRRPHRALRLRLIDAGGAVGELQAGAVLLATGGIGQAWPVTPPTPRPDGRRPAALALRAGAVVVPATQSWSSLSRHGLAPRPRVAASATASRSCPRSHPRRRRAADRHPPPAEPMTGVHPLGDLAPRDVVATAIPQAQNHEHRRRPCPAQHHPHFSAGTWLDHFPTILGLCTERGIDPRHEPIPVRPGRALRLAGCGQSFDGVASVPGLGAVGGVASTGVQGADRLASNSLTEALIASKRVRWRPRPPNDPSPSPRPIETDYQGWVHS